jgi:hypothetical protein
VKAAAGNPLAAARIRAIQRQAGNGAASRSVARQLQRKIDEATVAPVSKLLGITGKVQAVEVPKAATVKSVTPFKSYPADNTLNLGTLGDLTMLELQYPGVSDPDLAAMSANDIVDMMGGGAYNSSKDLVVLGQGYSQAALVHEMGHKAQNEAGMNTETAIVVVLEYHNFVYSENLDWASKKRDGKPRLSYGENIRPKKGQPTWAELKTAVQAPTHHSKPETLGMLEALEVTLESGRYQEDGDKAGKYGDQIKSNLITEFFSVYPAPPK